MNRLALSGRAAPATDTPRLQAQAEGPAQDRVRDREFQHSPAVEQHPPPEPQDQPVRGRWEVWTRRLAGLANLKVATISQRLPRQFFPRTQVLIFRVRANLRVRATSNQPANPRFQYGFRFRYRNSRRNRNGRERKRSAK